MVQALAFILGLLLAGYTLADGLALPIPGPVIGLVGLFALLRLGKLPLSGLDDVADGLIRFLPLFFVPAGVGLVLHLSRIAGDGIGIVLALLPGTLLALAGTAWLLRRLAPEDTADGDGGQA